jgi:hypothetical protein
MMEDVANEATSSHELVSANEQVQLDVVITKEHQQTSVHTMEKQE